MTIERLGFSLIHTIWLIKNLTSRILITSGLFGSRPLAIAARRIASLGSAAACWFTGSDEPDSDGVLK